MSTKSNGPGLQSSVNALVLLAALAPTSRAEMLSEQMFPAPGGWVFTGIGAGDTNFNRLLSGVWMGRLNDEDDINVMAKTKDHLDLDAGRALVTSVVIRRE